MEAKAKSFSFFIVNCLVLSTRKHIYTFTVNKMFKKIKNISHFFVPIFLLNQKLNKNISLGTQKTIKTD